MPFIVLFFLENSSLEFSNFSENAAFTSLCPLSERRNTFKRPCLLTTSMLAWKMPILWLCTHAIKSRLDVLVRDNESMLGL